MSYSDPKFISEDLYTVYNCINKLLKSNNQAPGTVLINLIQNLNPLWLDLKTTFTSLYSGSASQIPDDALNSNKVAISELINKNRDSTEDTWANASLKVQEDLMECINLAFACVRLSVALIVGTAVKKEFNLASLVVRSCDVSNIGMYLYLDPKCLPEGLFSLSINPSDFSCALTEAAVSAFIEQGNIRPLLESNALRLNLRSWQHGVSASNKLDRYDNLYPEGLNFDQRCPTLSSFGEVKKRIGVLVAHLKKGGGQFRLSNGNIVLGGFY